MADGEEIIFVGSPYFDSLGNLLDSETYLAKIPQDKIIMEIMFMNEQRKADVEMRYELRQTTNFMVKPPLFTFVCETCAICVGDLMLFFEVLECYIEPLVSSGLE